MIKATTYDAYRLFHEGALTLSQISSNGIRIDEKHYEKVSGELDAELESLNKKIWESEPGQLWKSQYGLKAKLNAGMQLEWLLYTKLGYDPVPTPGYNGDDTEDDRATMDAYVLKHIDLPMLTDLLRYRKLYKTRHTYIKDITKQAVDGYLHPNFMLHTTISGRGCIAKGSKILMPFGDKNIEDVKVGDLVYSYDDQLRPVIRKVLWAGKTGHKRVVELRWRNARDAYGKLRTTPEHEIRMSDGEWVQAQNIMNYACKGRKPKSPKRSVLAGHRIDDRMSFTNHARYEHRMIYEYFNGAIPAGMFVHHKDGNHENNRPENLMLVTSESHASIHYPKTLGTPEARARNKEVVSQMHTDGLYPVRHGVEVSNWLGLSRYQCLRHIAKARGRLTYVPFDFDSFKRHMEVCGIPLTVTQRYSAFGVYWGAGNTERVVRQYGLARAQGIMRMNYARVKELMAAYNLTYVRGLNNRPHQVARNNHSILSVTKVEDAVDVYDLEVEEFHNFIANEIVVHNSCSNPNFQNMSNRDKEQSKIIRDGIIPRNGRQLMEVDFKGAEVRIACCYHKDPTMLDYLLDETKDMHRDVALQAFKMEQSEITKGIRHIGKNMFTFPQFYGSTADNCAFAMWEASEKEKMASGMPLRKWMKAEGLATQAEFQKHIEEVCEDFWNNRFPVYTEWKNDFYKAYLRKGYFKLYTGFTCSGIMKKTQVCNFPVQGSAFHCLLYVLTELNKWLHEKKMKSLIIGQIHDSIVMDVVPEERESILEKAGWLIRKGLRKHWAWIGNVPMDAEAEASPVDEPWTNKTGTKL